MTHRPWPGDETGRAQPGILFCRNNHYDQYSLPGIPSVALPVARMPLQPLHQPTEVGWPRHLGSTGKESGYVCGHGSTIQFPMELDPTTHFPVAMDQPSSSLWSCIQPLTFLWPWIHHPVLCGYGSNHPLSCCQGATIQFPMELDPTIYFPVAMDPPAAPRVGGCPWGWWLPTGLMDQHSSDHIPVFLHAQN